MGSKAERPIKPDEKRINTQGRGYNKSSFAV